MYLSIIHYITEILLKVALNTLDIGRFKGVSWRHGIYIWFGFEYPENIQINNNKPKSL
jgi:hypothetical protein